MSETQSKVNVFCTRQRSVHLIKFSLTQFLDDKTTAIATLHTQLQQRQSDTRRFFISLWSVTQGYVGLLLVKHGMFPQITNCR